MVWQDLAMTATTLAVGYALVPQVIQGFKNKKGNIARQTAIITTIGMFAFATIFATMGMLMSTVISIFNGIMWSLLLIQKLIYK